MKKDFIFTFVTQLIILISGLMVFKLASIFFGDQGLAEFSLVKRNIAYIFTVVFLGLGVALPRYIALEIGKKQKNEDYIYASSVIIAFIALLFIGLLLLFFQIQIVFLIFGDESFAKYLVSIFLTIVGLTLQGIVYAYYRGSMQFNQANLIQIVNLGLAPLIAFLFAKNISQVFEYSAAIMILMSGAILTIHIIKYALLSKINIQSISTLLKYGLQRLPADFGLSSLLALPAIFYAHIDSSLAAGYVAFSISLLSLSGQAVAPVGMIMLPKISQLIGKNDFLQISFYAKKMLLIALLLSIFGTLIYELFAYDILSLYIGTPTEQLVNISKHIMWGALFYPIYVMMRSIIDAYYEKAYNVVSILSSLVSFVISFYISKNLFLSLLLSFAILAIATIYFLLPLLFYKLRKRNEKKC